MKIVVDMNLTPQWVAVLIDAGFEAQHWSRIGPADARDEEIMSWARHQGCAIFTHDLDFGALLALTRRRSPSVIQIRSQDIMPAAAAETVIKVLQTHSDALRSGCLLTIDEGRTRVKILPLLPA